MHLVEQALANGLWHTLLVGRPYDELADFLRADDYQTMAALADPAVGAGTPRGQAKPAALPAQSGPGPGYEHKKALEAVRNRYAVMLPIVRHTLHRLSADSGFRRTATQLREEGWRDWHLLTATANVSGDHRAQQQGLHPSPGDSPERRARILAVMQAPEPSEDPPVLAEARTERALRAHLSVAAVSTAHSFGLAVRHGFLGRQALLSVLGDRYGYWTDDVEHDDPFDWLAAEDAMTSDRGHARPATPDGRQRAAPLDPWRYHLPTPAPLHPQPGLPQRSVHRHRRHPHRRRLVSATGGSGW